MPDAFSNVAAGDPMPSSARLYNAILDGIDGTNPRDLFENFNWKDWNPITCKITLAPGVQGVYPFVPAAIVGVLDPAAGGLSQNNSGEPIFLVTQYFGSRTKHIESARIVFPTDYLYVNGAVTDAIVAGVIPASIHTRPLVNIVQPGRPLNRYVRPNLGINDLFANCTFIGLDQYWEQPRDYQNWGLGEILWYDPTLDGSNVNKSALVRFPAAFSHYWQAKNTAESRPALTSQWPAGPSPWPPTQPPPGQGIADNNVIGSPTSFAARVRGSWVAVRNYTTGTPAVEWTNPPDPAPQQSSARIHAAAELAVEIAFRITPASGPPLIVGNRILTEPAIPQIISQPSTSQISREFYLEHIFYACDLRYPIKVELIGRKLAGTGTQTLGGLPRLTAFDFGIHNTHGYAGQTIAPPVA